MNRSDIGLSVKLSRNQQILIEDYLSDGYKRVKQCIFKVYKRKLSVTEMEDCIGVAHEALIKAAKNYRSDKGMKFSSFASLNIKSSLKTQFTYENRDKRFINKIAESLDKPIDGTETLFLIDILKGINDVNIDTFEQSIRILKYLQGISIKEKKVLYLLWNGYTKSEIKEKYGYTTKQMSEIMLSLRKHDIVKILTRSENYAESCG